MASTPVTAAALWRIPQVGAPEPIPGHNRIVVPVKSYPEEGNDSVTRLYLVDDGHPVRALTRPDVSADQPAVSPDGRFLAFVRKPGGEAKDAGPKHPDQSQLYVLPLDGGEAERHTDLPLGVAKPKWLPDGRIAFVGTVFRQALTIEAATLRAKELAEATVKAHATEDRVYRFWDRWLTDGKVHHVFVLDLEAGSLIDLTPHQTRWMGYMEVDGVDVSPDGREIAFGAEMSEPPHDVVRFGVFAADVPPRGADETSAVVRCLTETDPGSCFRPRYSPDGRWIVYGMRRELDFYADKVRLVAYDRQAHAHTVLTEAWDASAEGWAFELPSNRSAALIFAAEDRGERSLFRLDVERSVEEPERAVPEVYATGGWYGDPRVAAGRWLATHQSLSAPAEVVGGALPADDDAGASREPREGRGHPLTTFTSEAMAGLSVGAVENLTFPGADGREVQMFIVHGPGHEPGDGPLPLVHMIHGGPHGVFGNLWHGRWNAQAFAAPGYLVALVNFHGSTGWGQGFTASILGRWGDQPYQDVMAATDMLVESRRVDPERMAITGGSYGGYLVAWICSQSSRFTCAVNHAGVVDFQTQYASDMTQGRRRSFGGEPWDDVAGMDRYNPMRHAAGFTTPTLVIHGMNDYRVPYAQGLEMYNVLKAKGVPARLVVYPDENHWVLKPANSRHWYGEVLGWLERWLRA